MDCYFLGVDGGGTKTVAAVSDQYGRVLGIGQGGPVNIGWVGPDTAAESTKTAVHQALAAAKISPRQVAQSYLGMASVESDRDDDDARSVFLQAMQSMGFAIETTTVDNDAFIGLASAIGPGPGVVVVGGTGFTAKGVGADGRRITLPWYVAERGAGHIVGRLAAKTALFDLLHVGPASSMTPSIMNALGMADAVQLERWLAVRRPSWELGRLAPLVTEAAKDGDKAAMELLHTAGMEFGLAAVFIAREANLSACTVAMIGGVFKAGDFISLPMRAVLAASGVEAALVPPLMQPVGGAIALAWGKAGLLACTERLLGLAGDLNAKLPMT